MCGGGGRGSGAVTSHKYRYRDVPLEYAHFSAQRLYDVSFSASNYMNSHTFSSAHYINSLLFSANDRHVPKI